MNSSLYFNSFPIVEDEPCPGRITVEVLSFEIIFNELCNDFSSPPGRSTRPISPLKSVSPVNKISSISKHTPPFECPGVKNNFIEKIVLHKI